MIYSLTSAALVAVSFTSVLVDAAPASVQARQNINLCTPIVPSRADSVLTGSKINFSAGNGLFFNATFPTRDFSKDFTGVELAYKINNKDWTVSEWYVQEAPNNEWKISSGVGPSNDQWCLTTGGKGAPCSEAISFAIECNDCSNLYGPFKRCSLRESWHATRNAGACLKWGSSAGSKVTEGDIIYGPYDCPNTVDIIQATNN